MSWTTTFTCDYCGHISDTKDDAKTHAAEWCIANPKRRNCESCDRFFDPKCMDDFTENCKKWRKKRE